MLTNIVLCLSFVIGAAVMYFGIRKITGIVDEGYEGIEAAPCVDEEMKEASPECDKTSRKPRISLRIPRINLGKPENPVLVGNAKPYRIDIRKA